MDTITLDQEKFKTAQELADLNMALLAGQGELQKLRIEEETYTQAREKRVLTRIGTLLQESEQALQDVSSNHDLLRSYTSEATKFYESLTELHTDLLTTIDLFNEHVTLAEESLTTREKTLKTDTEKIKAQKLILESDLKTLRSDKQTLEKERVLLKDRQDTLRRGFEELRRKQS